MTITILGTNWYSSRTGSNTSQLPTANQFFKMKGPLSVYVKDGKSNERGQSDIKILMPQFSFSWGAMSRFYEVSPNFAMATVVLLESIR